MSLKSAGREAFMFAIFFGGDTDRGGVLEVEMIRRSRTTVCMHDSPSASNPSRCSFVININNTAATMTPIAMAIKY